MNTRTSNFSKAERERLIRRVILIEGLANLVVLVAKAVVGFGTGSVAILADAIHSLTDVANNVVAWFVIRVSVQPPDREHPYGHGKFEMLAVFFLAALLTVVAIELVIHAFRRETPVIIQSTWGFQVMIGVLLVNILLSWWQRRWAKRLQSDILLADASHTFSDVLTTVVVIVGWQLSVRGYVWLDTACAIAVAIFVFYLAFTLFKKVVPVLVDQIAVQPEKLEKSILDIGGVQDVRRLRSRWQGTELAVDMVISVNSSLSAIEAHDIADEIEDQLRDKFSVHDISIHVEPQTAHDKEPE